VDDTTSPVVGGEELDDGFNRSILPPNNPRAKGKPSVYRIESQT